MNLAIELPIARYRLHFVANSPFRLPPYAGSAWRGLFGHVLKSTVCVTHEPHCQRCLLWRNCVYSSVFETPPPPNSSMMRKYPAVPHPYVIQPLATSGANYREGEAFFLELKLFGQAERQLPYLLHTFQTMGRRGIGRDEGKFTLSYLEQWQTDGTWELVYTPDSALQTVAAQVLSIPPCPSSAIRLTMQTPLRLLRADKIMLPERFSLDSVVMSAARRLSSLQYFHTGRELVTDFAALKAQVSHLHVVTQDLYWQDWTRYSNRQQELINMGGLMGSVVIRGEALEVCWPWLYYAHMVNLGKGTVFGLGDFSLHAV